MSWSSPPTFVTGNILTASQLNTYLRDNTLALRGAPRVRVTQGANLTLAHGVLTEVPWGAEQIDTHGMHTGGSPSRLTVPAGWAGDYLVIATPEFDSNINGLSRYGEIQINNSLRIANSEVVPPIDVTRHASFGISTLWFPVAGDFFTLWVYQDRGGDLWLIDDNYGATQMAAYFVGYGAG